MDNGYNFIALNNQNSTDKIKPKLYKVESVKELSHLNYEITAIDYVAEKYERINNSNLTELIVTDTIPMTQKSEKIRVITAANLFSDVIHKLINNQSISGHFVIS